MEISSFPSIFATYHPAIRPLLDCEDVIAEEKVDGSQFSFGVLDGELVMRSKGAIIQAVAPMKMFALAAETVSGLHAEGALKEGWIYRGEYLMKPKHNTLTYERVPAGNIIIFDITDPQGNFLDPESKAEEAARLGLETVPLLYRGMFNLAEIEALLEKVSCLGGPRIEGVVIKPAAYDIYGKDKKVLLGKFVSASFKELHKLEWKSTNPGRGDTIMAIQKALSTDARYEKAIQHLADKGELAGEPRDIGPLMKELRDDLEREVKDWVAERLLAAFWDDILRGAVKKFPMWYKARLAAENVVPMEPEPVDPDTSPAWRISKE